MTKQEFLEILGKSLKRELSDVQVEENLRYYDQYIAQQMRSGRTEADILSELGDPRLIARTILQVDRTDAEQETVYTEEEDCTFRRERVRDENGFYVRRTTGIQVWIRLILTIVVIIMLVSTVFRIAFKLLPLFLVLAVVLWVYREFIKK